MNCLTFCPAPAFFFIIYFFVVVQAGSICVCRHAHPALAPLFVLYIFSSFFLSTLLPWGPRKCVKIMPQLERLDTSERKTHRKYTYTYIIQRRKKENKREKKKVGKQNAPDTDVGQTKAGQPIYFYFIDACLRLLQSFSSESHFFFSSFIIFFFSFQRR